MFTRKHFINNFSLALLIIIGSLFIYRYSTRFLGYFPFITIIYILLFLISVFVTSNQKFENSKIISRKRIIIFLIVSTIIASVVIPFIPESSGVSRLPALKEWISNLLAGEFPYRTFTHSSGFPFLYLISFPFYLIGKIGYLELSGYLLFWLCLIYISKSVKTLLIRIILLMLMPAFYYEFLVNSELFFNMALVISLVILTEKFLHSDKIDFRFTLFAVIYGLVLSTRLNIGVFYIIYLLWFFRQNINKLILFAGIAFLSFLLTVLPFAIWDPGYFFESGPFIIQFQYLPQWTLIIFLFVLLFTGWVVSNMQEVFFATGLMSFFLVTAYFIYYIYYSGLEAAIFGKYCFDMSYFIFCIPFLILSVEEYKIDNYLGKVYINNTNMLKNK